jgi:hypothetical protein
MPATLKTWAELRDQVTQEVHHSPDTKRTLALLIDVLATRNVPLADVPELARQWGVPDMAVVQALGTLSHPDIDALQMEFRNADGIVPAHIVQGKLLDFNLGNLPEADWHAYAQSIKVSWHSTGRYQDPSRD